MKRFVVSLSVVLAASFCAAQQGGDFKVEVEKDIAFGKGGDKELKLDLARPVSIKGPAPCIVCVHGGGWRQGSRQDLSNPSKDFGGQGLIGAFAAKGYVAATVNYRLTDVAKFPAQIEDCNAAVRFLRANAKKYGIDPDRFGAIGFSAGGHLVCLMGLANKTDGLEGQGGNAEQSSRVQAVCSFFGPTDFSKKTWTADIEKSLLEPLVGASFEKDPAGYKKASPLTYATKNAPPFLFVHGTKDPLVALEHSEKLQSRLLELGVSAELLRMDGLGHGWGGQDALKSFNAALKFFGRTLKK